MTCLSACQSALVRLIGKKPATVFSSSEQTVVEIADLVTEVGVDIMKSHDWQALTKIQSVAGNGTDTAFPLPDDYDRMVLAQGVSDANSWFWGYTQVPDMDTWIMIQNGFYLGIVAPGWWMLTGGQFQFNPAPASGATAKYPYVSKNFAIDPSGTPKGAFINDNDTFVLDERLLTLGLIWRWRAQKRLEYAEDMQTYEIALSQAQARDRGATVIRSNGRYRPTNTRFGWPWTLGPDIA
jgi:hypothetical protein